MILKKVQPPDPKFLQAGDKVVSVPERFHKDMPPMHPLPWIFTGVSGYRDGSMTFMFAHKGSSIALGDVTLDDAFGVEEEVEVEE